ncbi:MAG TPA: hypothetical protein VGF28_20545 [Thermoanaerobaculia bacterium]|jgi:hypothetical protein
MDIDTYPEFVQDVAEAVRPEAPAVNLTGWETVRFQLDDMPPEPP